ncbi:MAG: shikimate kinase [Desulfobulbaceae bacterium]|nr:MAG: shikimate kinase [Desulfobulbaceae bacterium]
MQTDNIILIGFMASGKGRTARGLFRMTGKYAVDCDDLIESLCNMKVKQIFEEHGEAHFRQLEQLTADWIRLHLRNSVISTGGGFLNVNGFKQLGTIVYLHGDFQYIIDTLYAHPNAKKKIKKRPLLQNMNKAEELYQKRVPLYRQVADLEVSIEGKTTDTICREIVCGLKLCV